MNKCKEWLTMNISIIFHDDTKFNNSQYFSQTLQLYKKEFLLHLEKMLVILTL